MRKDKDTLKAKKKAYEEFLKDLVKSDIPLETNEECGEDVCLEDFLRQIEGELED